MRWFKRRKKNIALALSSGAARGIAHLGALEVILASGYCIEAVAGTSIGSIAAAFLSLYGDIEGLKKLALETDWPLMLKLLDINPTNLFKGGLIQGRRVEEFLKQIFGDYTFKDCKIPIVIVATDIITGKPVEINTGKLWHAIRASISIPGIFTPVEIAGKTLIDGGVSMPLPSKILKEKGFSPIWAINVLSNPPEMAKDKKHINIIETLIQSIFIMESSISNEQATYCDKVICPDVGNFPFYDFTNAEKLINLGRKAAEKMLSI